ncbi:MAG: zinc ABC transporter substrate-binding protein [Nitrospirota bacterium]
MPVRKSVISEKFTALIFIISLLTINNSFAATKGKIKITASFYPLAHFAEQVGSDYADVTNIMPPGAEPHEFEPTPRDIKKVYTSDIFLFHGAGIDPWAERIWPDLKKQGTAVLKMAEHISITHSDPKFNGNRYSDPHTWLDPLLAIREVEAIRDALIYTDADNKEIYNRNSQSYIRKLSGLHEKFVSGLKDCSRQNIIVSHNAFSYMADRYGLTIHSITGISPEEEPSARKMIELVKLARKMNIKFIFFEELLSPRLAETIADEAGAKTLVLNPLGGLTSKNIDEGRTYISVMEDNLRNLRIALECR